MEIIDYFELKNAYFGELGQSFREHSDRKSETSGQHVGSIRTANRKYLDSMSATSGQHIGILGHLV